MVSVQVGAALAKQMFAAVGAEGAVTLRVVLAAVILVAAQQGWRMRLSWPELKLLLPYGVILGVMNLCFYTALKTVPLGVVVALEFTGPLAVAVLDSRRARDLVWVTLAVLGIFLMDNPFAQGAVDTHGVLFALAAGIVTLLVLRPLLRRERLDFAVGGAEHDFVVGQMGVVEEHVVNDESTGVIEIDGEVWTARAHDDGQTFAPGDAVEVVAVRGAVALVDAPEKPRSADVRA